MQNKCQNCGHILSQGDIFCSRCGKKISEKLDVISAINQFDDKTRTTSKEKNVFFKSNLRIFSNNIVVSALIILFMMALAVGILMFFILNKHDGQREVLQFKNLISNPAQIPLLKEPSSYEDLKNNLSAVEDFLLLYLQQSDDTKEKKEQVFYAYIDELNKLPNILNEKFENNIIECSKAKSAVSCVGILNKTFKNTGVSAYSNAGIIYLYPDYKFIKNKFYDYISYDFKRFAALKAKYNQPVSLGLELNIPPKKLANKIYEFEKLLSHIDNQSLKEEIEHILYDDCRKFIFTPSIYSTITQEMTKDFSEAFDYFVNSKKNSAFRPLIMSYVDKKRSFNDENFKKEYPFKMYNNAKFDENVKNSIFNDIFVQLRKNFFANKNENLSLSYIYNIQNAQWRRYSKDVELMQSEYVLTEPDENNNVSIYNHMFSPMQELNILKYSKLYLINSNLYVFNKDKLSLSKINFNGKIFNLYNLSFSDITSLFPGIEVINMDDFSNYNVIIQKDNAKAAFIVMSRYSQGWNDYNIDVIKGEINMLTLPNMFSVDTLNNIIVSFGASSVNTEEIYENSPSYKFTIKTKGEKPKEEQENEYVQYDKKTEKEQKDENEHKPNIMPKLLDKNDITEIETPPLQEIDPPMDDEEKR